MRIRWAHDWREVAERHNVRGRGRSSAGRLRRKGRTVRLLATNFLNKSMLYSHYYRGSSCSRQRAVFDFAEWEAGQRKYKALAPS